MSSSFTGLSYIKVDVVQVKIKLLVWEVHLTLRREARGPQERGRRNKTAFFHFNFLLSQWKQTNHFSPWQHCRFWRSSSPSSQAALSPELFPSGKQALQLSLVQRSHFWSGKHSASLFCQKHEIKLCVANTALNFPYNSCNSNFGVFFFWGFIYNINKPNYR